MAVEPRTVRTIESIQDLAGVMTMRANAERQGVLDGELESLLRQKERTLYEDQLLQRLGRQRDDLSPAEAEALAATADYQRFKRQQGTNASRSAKAA